MSSKVLSAGDYILSRCTKCKDTLGHTIVAMVGDKVVKVECNTCGSVHAHRESKPKTTTKRTTAAAKPRTQTKAQQNWEELLQKAEREGTEPYSMKTPMKEDMLIVHPTFGLGQVVNCIRPNKMEVQFQDGIKMLRCKLG
ncbi:hypothetical protein SAMN02745165_01971 [Malonomonas rubra DSM 5091]|uniref:Uncharacterized protein n=1 Tax=Malonomonas rubra DSM 5091 TaxID=1122189 RepID=A0A1M6I1H6_MALRU|nr:hypothetical protein [Malonomonas rubra]SHJ28303.1 hypothetical protein SAMN02745165_01971 [Malonomonas rubra DSM 5091]